MSNNHAIKEAINTFYQGIMDQLTREHADNYDQLIASWLEIHAHYIANANNFLEQWAEDAHLSHSNEADLKQITANQVVVEITDQNTGRTFRRTLPLEYMETDNGIRLSGDTLEGTPSHLAFLSEIALLRMKDILGKGPDTHRCHD